MRTSMSAIAAAAVLCACGGGGDSGDVAVGGSGGGTPGAGAQSQGLWNGTTNTNRTATALVLSDGTYYLLYSAPGNASVIAGWGQGHTVATGSSFNSADGRDFNFEGQGVIGANLSGTYSTRQSINGTVTYPAGGTVTFAGTYDSSYEIAPSIATVAGTYTGQVASPVGVQNAVFSILSNGAITGNASGCTASGTITPRTDGNSYNAVVAFGPSPCVFAGQTFTGAAYYNASTKRIYAAAPNALRNAGVLFLGTKP